MAYDLEATSDAVRAGMELLVWQVDDDDWRELGAVGSSITESRKQHARSLGGLGAIATVVILPPVFFFTWPPDQAAVYGFLINVALLPLAGVAAYAAALGATRGTFGHDLPVLPVPPRVVITSNGITVGGRAWLWRAPRYRLVGASLHADNPTQLRLKFRGRGWRRWLASETIEIPFPDEMRQDLTELIQLLEVKTQLT